MRGACRANSCYLCRFGAEAANAPGLERNGSTRA